MSNAVGHRRAIGVAALVAKFGIATVVVPAVGAIAGALLMACIPGCHCDEGAGCGGCGALNGVVALLLMGGFVGALAAAFTSLPAALLLAVAIRWFARGGRPAPKGE